MSLLARILWSLLGLALVLVAYWLSQWGFDQLRQLRQISQIPLSQSGAILPGPTKLEGRIQYADNPLVSEYFNQPAVYYRFVEEEERRDSEGKTYWSTVRSFERSQSFYLVDAAGLTLIEPVSSRTNWRLDKTQSVVVGKRRYSEWRLAENDFIFVFGTARLTQNGEVIALQLPTPLEPMVSIFGESNEQSSTATKALILIAVSVSIFVFSLFCVTRLFLVHRVLLYCLLATILIMVVLGRFGLVMLNDDLNFSLSRVAQMQQGALERINLNRSSPLAWEDLKESINLTPRQQAIIQTVAEAEWRVQQSLSKAPTWLLDLESSDHLGLAAQLLSTQQVSAIAKRQTIPTTQSFWSALIIGISLLIVILAYWLGLKWIKVKRTTENIPTSQVAATVCGINEVKGRIDDDEHEFLTGPLTHVPCVWYDYRVEQRKGSGKNAKWVVIEQDTKAQRFWLKDNSGRIQVAPDDAKIITKHSAKKRSGRYRYFESTIQRNDSLYLLAPTAVDQYQHDRLIMKKGEQDEPFIIANKTEHQVMIGLANVGLSALSLALAAYVFSVLFALGLAGEFSPVDFLWASLTAPIFLFLVGVILHYNDIIFLRQRVTRNLANIDVALQKRFDLINNLIKVVKGYSAHEASVFTKITEIRSQAEQQSDNKNQFARLLEKMSSGLFILGEEYPTLKSDELYVKLMDNNKDIENEIALMREGYNHAVEVYNTRIVSFPDVFLAKAFKFTDKEFYRFVPT